MGRQAVAMVSSIMVFLSLAWLYPLYVGDWHHKRYLIMGLAQVELRITLAEARIKGVCPPIAIKRFEGWCHELGANRGWTNLQVFRDIACHAASESKGLLGHCQPIKNVYWGGLAVLFVSACGLVMYLTGLGFLHFYWFHQQRRKYRQAAYWLSITGPCLILVAALLYCLLNWNLQGFLQVPPMLVVKPIATYQGVSLSTGAFAAVMLPLIMFMAPYLMFALVGKHINEEYYLDLREQRLAEKEGIYDPDDPRNALLEQRDMVAENQANVDSGYQPTFSI